MLGLGFEAWFRIGFCLLKPFCPDYLKYICCCQGCEDVALAFWAYHGIPTSRNSISMYALVVPCDS